MRTRKDRVGPRSDRDRLLLLVPAANAHEHRICTPGQGDPLIGEEPFHAGPGTTPGNSEADLSDNPNYSGAWGFHPIHSSVHKGPKGENPDADHIGVNLVVAGEDPACP